MEITLDLEFYFLFFYIWNFRDKVELDLKNDELCVNYKKYKNDSFYGR